MLRSSRWAAGGVACLVSVMAACGSSKTATPMSSSIGTKAGATTTMAAGAANPNAKEQLPPGDIPDNQVYVAYAPPTGGYTFTYPQGWSQRHTAFGTTFSQYFNSIHVASTKAATAPTIASARVRELAKLVSLPGFKLITVDSVTRTSGPAVRVVYELTSPKNPVTGKSVTLQVERYLFWHSGKLLTITLSSPKGSDNVDPWKTVTESLAWK
jgi:hypothetical protein